MTTEIKSNAKNPVIDLMEDQKSLTTKGGTMRLGAYNCKIEKDSLANKIYGTLEISERHRHRYEMNNIYVDMLSQKGLVPSGKNLETGLVEIVEIPAHPFFIGVQFHPELKSTPENPHPLFVALVKAAMKRKRGEQ
jgi:CTP synthase